MSALVPVYGRSGVVAHAQVDEADFDLVSQYRWTLGSKGYAITAKYLGGGRSAPRYFRTRMHRLILGLEPGDPRQGDHRNGEVLDNQRSNLRVVTQPQNAQNRRDSRGQSRHRGVYFDRVRGKWRGQVRVEGKAQTKYFQEEQDAADWAREKRRELLPFSEEVASSLL